MVLEYAEFGSVMKGEMELDSLPEHKCRKYFRDAVMGLEYLHSCRVIHRDIKPENLLLFSDDVVKISDFGVSIRLDTEVDQKSLKKTVGSPIFLPPELCASETPKISGPAVDIWALGVTLYFFVFGKFPFLGDTEMQMYDNIRSQKLQFPNKVDKDLQDLLQKLLKKNPDRRISIKDIKKHPWFAKIDK